MNLLTHSNGMTRIGMHDILMESSERPELPFAFDALYYEPPTGLSFKVLAGEQQPLTSEDVAACETYCDAFLDAADYTVFAYDATGIYAGSLLRSEATARGLAYRLVEAPDHPASKWTGERWERIAASILDDGTLLLKPEGVCARCALALTASEWAAFPAQPAVANDEDWKWDFAAEAWRDVADPTVFAFDEVGAFVGALPRSMVLQRGWEFLRIPPQSQPYKVVDTGRGWERVEAVIYEDGHVELRPPVIRDDVILLFTREEWARWPARPAANHDEIWVWDFVAETWRDVADFYAAAFEIEGEQAGLFVGGMLRSEAETRGLGWTRVFPNFSSAKWNGQEWQAIYAVIMDDGSVRRKPDGVCQRCMLVFTEQEWAAFPQPEREIPERLGGWTWNFALERWEDRRKSDDVRNLVRRVLGYQVSMLRECRLECFGFLQDIDELRLAAGEAEAWQAGTGATPFLDAFLAKTPNTDRSSLVTTLLAEYRAVVAVWGETASLRRTVMADVAACVDTAALDAAFVRHMSEFDTLEKAACGTCSRK